MTEVEEVEEVKEVKEVKEVDLVAAESETVAAGGRAAAAVQVGSTPGIPGASEDVVGTNANVEPAPDEDEGEGGDVIPPPIPPPVFRVMVFDDVSLDLPTQYPVVTLIENEPPLRSLVFPVGLAEGTALALALRRMESPRPTTHELFMEVMQRGRIDVIALRLNGRENGNYLAELDVMTPLGRERISCRPSDGLVLALRMPVSAPILVDERLFEDPGDVVPLWDG
jgi:bifunctional DNase/RNase